MKINIKGFNLNVEGKIKEDKKISFELGFDNYEINADLDKIATVVTDTVKSINKMYSEYMEKNKINIDIDGIMSAVIEKFNEGSTSEEKGTGVSVSDMSEFLNENSKEDENGTIFKENKE